MSTMIADPEFSRQAGLVLQALELDPARYFTMQDALEQARTLDDLAPRARQIWHQVLGGASQKTVVHVRPYTRNGKPVAGYEREADLRKKLKSVLDAHIKANGPWGYHMTADERIDSILQHGIEPTGVHDSVDPSSVGLGTPRPDVAYISVPSKPGTDHYFAYENALRIDLRKLDAARLTADEDHGLDLHHHLYGVPHESWGELAHHHRHLMDHPDTVAYSLAHGSVAIYGGVPADAISLNPAYEAEKSAVMVRPYIRDGHPVSGYTREKMESAFELPKSGKVAKAVREALAVLDGLMHVPGLPPVKVTATSGKNKRGGYQRPTATEGAFMRISAAGGDPDTDRYGIWEPKLTFTHEVGHLLDNQGFNNQHEGPRYETTALWLSRMTPEERQKGMATLTPESREGLLANYGQDPQSPLAAWWEAATASPEYEQLRTASMMEYGTHAYLVSPKEMFARSFAQWVATRSQDETMMKAMRAWQTLPEEHSITIKVGKHGDYLGGRYLKPGETFTRTVGIPRSLRYRQWSEESFAPIGAALDRVFADLGWLKGSA